MIARVALDADALNAFADGTPRSRNVHTAVTRVLRDHGTLTFPSTTDLLELLAAIDNLDPDSKSLWQASLKALHTTRRDTTLAGQTGVHTTCGTPQGAQRLAGEVDLIAVCEEVARNLELPPPGHSRLNASAEVSLLESVAACDTVRGLEQLVREPNYPEGASREAIWQSHIMPLARGAERVVIRDRYLLAKWPDRRERGVAHLTWILERLDEVVAPTARVTIIAADFELEPAARQDEAHTSLASYLAQLPLISSSSHRMQVNLVPWKRWANWTGETAKAHNRYIRFDGWAALAVEEGFDRLSQPDVWGVDGITLRRIFAEQPSQKAGTTELARRHRQERGLEGLATWRWPQREH
ncbi:hypothetical protein QQX10_10665 [Demequina sp. SYSU T00039]|uniref:Uncharacterized protein n=1 Tax=Demequina lignilytica TaxID=3051663 RepID=A0AAW7M264_9MICO|nr:MULTISPECIES: hypothetical protein [unclassified Demequina]MDN4478651.1 hypothetical protein [Demequina sp. SYSU T00039-1]MDN4488629.1 hypothetical protein [Demequina sp. SYSU T00039]